MFYDLISGVVSLTKLCKSNLETVQARRTDVAWLQRAEERCGTCSRCNDPRTSEGWMCVGTKLLKTFCRVLSPDDSTPPLCSRAGLQFSTGPSALQRTDPSQDSVRTQRLWSDAFLAFITKKRMGPTTGRRHVVQCCHGELCFLLAVILPAQEVSLSHFPCWLIIVSKHELVTTLECHLPGSWLLLGTVMVCVCIHSENQIGILVNSFVRRNY